ncbi:MAG: SUMF1/EgtB/PvdO family nonheme iron enzyme [Spirochaetaceae bacterium]|nr:SUMF1/EgtB/PvdO family nonheme iron enzyme [Spirochaetaceae bacterium]
MKKNGKLFLCALLMMCAFFLVAQETVSSDNVDALTLQMDELLKERSALEKKEASVLQTIEDGVSSYQKGELAKRYAELEQYKDYFEAQEYQDARAEEERQVAALAQEERRRLEQNAKPELDNLVQEKKTLTEKIEGLEKILLNLTYKIHTAHVVETKYDTTTKAINIRFIVPEFEESYDIAYAFNTTDLSTFEIAKKGAEEEGKDYSADIYYTVTKDDGTDFYVITMTSMDLYYADGEKIVSDFPLFSSGKRIRTSDFFFNVANMKINIKDGFVLVAGGTFEMGNNNSWSNESPKHSVSVSSFFMNDHEVTQAEYKAIMGTNPSYYTGDSRPVEKVSWYDAIEYCNKLSLNKGLNPCYSLNGTVYTSRWGAKGSSWNNVVCDFSANGYRLPTEAELEYSARGGVYSMGYKYSGSNDIEKIANYNDVGFIVGSTKNVMTKQPNELWLYDMTGNVREWCWDWDGSYSSSSQTNPAGAASGSYRIYRGGGWNDTTGDCGVTYRGSKTPGSTSNDLGFRVVRTDVKSIEQIQQSESSSDNSASTTSEVKNDFILVEGGSFKMGNNSGDSDEKPVHSVSISSFYMSDHEVTQAEYKAITGNNPSESAGDDKPVEEVSWLDAIIYCSKLSQMKGLTPCYVINGDNVSCNFAANGFRLPTEAEWEYAARGGNKSKDYTYSGSNSLVNIAWYTDNSKSQTHDVKMKTANELGLYDMSGNVWEWCWDFYGSYSSNAQINPTGILSGSSHVRRGGSWYSGDDFCSVSVRSGRAFNYKDGLTGFRVVRSVSDGFVLVAGGTFEMGSNSRNSAEKPVHEVTVSSFYMSDHEVTQAEYKAIMGTNPSYFSGDDKPVEKVSWYDAIEYCNKLSEMKGLTPCYSKNGNTYTCDWNASGYRLPTEAEWEYAARGGNKSRGYTYSGSNDIENVAWYSDNSNKLTHAVKEKQPNELGIYDMSGNVWEWCWDWYGSYNNSAQRNPTGASSGSYRVLRGGSWDEGAFSCRVAVRLNYFSPGRAHSPLGFRVVRSAN